MKPWVKSQALENNLVEAINVLANVLWWLSRDMIWVFASFWLSNLWVQNFSPKLVKLYILLTRMFVEDALTSGWSHVSSSYKASIQPSFWAFLSEDTGFSFSDVFSPVWRITDDTQVDENNFNIQGHEQINQWLQGFRVAAGTNGSEDILLKFIQSSRQVSMGL